MFVPVYKYILYTCSKILFISYKYAIFDICRLVQLNISTLTTLLIADQCFFSIVCVRVCCGSVHILHCVSIFVLATGLTLLYFRNIYSYIKIS